MALPEIRKTRASQARETAASEKNTQVNIAQTAIQADISTFTKRTAESLKSMFSLQKSQFELERLKAGAELEKEREAARKGSKKEKSVSFTELLNYLINEALTEYQKNNINYQDLASFGAAIFPSH